MLFEAKRRWVCKTFSKLVAKLAFVAFFPKTLFNFYVDFGSLCPSSPYTERLIRASSITRCEGHLKCVQLKQHRGPSHPSRVSRDTGNWKRWMTDLLLRVLPGGTPFLSLDLMTLQRTEAGKHRQTPVFHSDLAFIQTYPSSQTS